MNNKKKLRVKYSFVDYEIPESQKKIDDAFDEIFDEVETEDIDRLNNNEYEHYTTIKRRNDPTN